MNAARLLIAVIVLWLHLSCTTANTDFKHHNAPNSIINNITSDQTTTSPATVDQVVQISTDPHFSLQIELKLLKKSFHLPHEVIETNYQFVFNNWHFQRKTFDKIRHLLLAKSFGELTLCKTHCLPAVDKINLNSLTANFRVSGQRHWLN